MSQRFEAQVGASAVVAHAHRFTLQGEPASLDFPALCANCGDPAAGRIAYSKVFRRTHSDSPTEHVVSSVEVPFCNACTARHRGQEQVPTPLGKVLSSFATGEMLGAVFPGLAAAFVVWLALKDLFHGQWLRTAVMFGVAFFFGLIAWSQRRYVWRDTEHLRVPPQSDITEAFDFSDDVAAVFEPPRFICTVRDARFAEAFAALNRDRRWVAHSPAAIAGRQQARRKTWLIGGIIAAIVLASIVLDWFR